VTSPGVLLASALAMPGMRLAEIRMTDNAVETNRLVVACIVSTPHVVCGSTKIHVAR
jgi:hypothetical protein